MPIAKLTGRRLRRDKENRKEYGSFWKKEMKYTKLRKPVGNKK